MAEDDDAPEGTLALPLAGLPPRYRDLGVIGVGGMGVVHRVLDQALGRAVALKVIRLEVAGNELARFREEARTHAQLDHPAIVPVHDFGELADGRPWFSMREVRGMTLAELLRRAPEDRRPSLHRLVDMLAQTCRAVAYAHGRGVIHRDLKPSNVMVGELGEVQVMDWGLGKRLGAPEPEVRGPQPPGVDRGRTRPGVPFGTPAYMAPEQARGEIEQVGPPADVFALGAILYEILVGVPPHQGDSLVPTLARAYVARPRQVEDVAATSGRAIPAELARLCERALRGDPAERPTAAELVKELSRWLDGETRREEAREIVRDAERLLPEIRRLKQLEQELLHRSRSLLAALPAFAPTLDRAEAWAAEDEAQEVGHRLDLLEVEYEQRLRGALASCPDLTEAHRALALHHREGLLEAERRRDAREQARQRELLLRHDDGTQRTWLDCRVPVVLRTEPAGAEVLASRYVVAGRRLVPGPSQVLGRTPLEAELPIGSWRLELRHPDRPPVVLPLLLERDDRHPTLPPGASEVPPIVLPERIHETECYVPPGWFVWGGDHLAVDSLPRTRLWVEGFFLQRHPVTNAEYLEFLEDLWVSGREDLARGCAPSLPSISGGARGTLSRGGPQALWVREAGRWIQHQDDLTPEWDARAPVVRVDLACVRAYAAWRSRRDGLAWRLPTEVEWEKAARGVDGRWWPWGDHHEPGWSRMVTSVELPGLAPVDEHPEDESPYGVRGLGGNARDWTCSEWVADPGLRDGQIAPVVERTGEYQVVKGGSYSAREELCRPAGRLTSRPADRYPNCGIRLARSLG